MIFLLLLLLTYTSCRSSGALQSCHLPLYVFFGSVPSDLTVTREWGGIDITINFLSLPFWLRILMRRSSSSGFGSRLHFDLPESVYLHSETSHYQDLEHQLLVCTWPSQQVLIVR